MSRVINVLILGCNVIHLYNNVFFMRDTTFKIRKNVSVLNYEDGQI